MIATTGGRAPFDLRDCEESDIGAITRLYAHYVLTSLATFEEIPPTPETMTQRCLDVRRAGLPFLVARGAQGELLGFAYAAFYRTRSAYRFTIEDSIYVAPEAIRHGLGGALLGGLIERCTESGFRQMVAVIGDNANAASIGLHEKMGFARVGLLPATGFKFGRWVDSVIMQRTLGPGSATTPV